MSSAYRVLCLSHDPGIELDGEWRSAEEALQVVQARSLNHEVAQHRKCDLVVGAYSYPLARVWCPPCSTVGDTRGGAHSGYHREAVAVDAFWLRLLWRSYRESALQKEAGRAPGCWRPGRLNRLRNALDVHS